MADAPAVTHERRTRRSTSDMTVRAPKTEHIITDTASRTKMRLCRNCNHPGTCKSRDCTKTIYIEIGEGARTYDSSGTAYLTLARETLVEMFTAFIEIVDESRHLERKGKGKLNYGTYRPLALQQ